MILFLIIYQQYFLPKSVEVVSHRWEKTTHKQKYLLIKSFCFSSQPQVGELLMWFQELLRHLFAIRLFPCGRTIAAALSAGVPKLVSTNSCAPGPSGGSLAIAVFPLQIAIIYLMSQIFLAEKYFHTLWYISVYSEPASLFRIQLNALFSFQIEKKTFIPHLCRIILQHYHIP